MPLHLNTQSPNGALSDSGVTNNYTPSPQIATTSAYPWVGVIQLLFGPGTWTVLENGVPTVLPAGTAEYFPTPVIRAVKNNTANAGNVAIDVLMGANNTNLPLRLVGGEEERVQVTRVNLADTTVTDVLLWI